MVGLLKEKCLYHGSALVPIADRLDIQRQQKPEFQELTVWLFHWNLTYAQTASFPTTDTSNNIGFSRSYRRDFSFLGLTQGGQPFCLLYVSHSNEPSQENIASQTQGGCCASIFVVGDADAAICFILWELSQYTQDTGLLKSPLKRRFLNPCRVLLPPLEYISIPSIKWFSVMICGMSSHSRSQLYYDWTGKLT